MDLRMRQCKVADLFGWVDACILGCADARMRGGADAWSVDVLIR